MPDQFLTIALLASLVCIVSSFGAISGPSRALRVLGVVVCLAGCITLAVVLLRELP